MLKNCWGVLKIIISLGEYINEDIKNILYYRFFFFFGFLSLYIISAAPIPP